MNDVVNSLLNGFSSMLALGTEYGSNEVNGCACAGSGPSASGSCCKSKLETQQATVNKRCECGHSHSDGPTEIESMKILYSSLTGTAKQFAAELESKLRAEKNVAIQSLQLLDITEYDNDDLLTETAVCVFILSCYNVEGPLDW